MGSTVWHRLVAFLLVFATLTQGDSTVCDFRVSTNGVNSPLCLNSSISSAHPCKTFQYLIDFISNGIPSCFASGNTATIAVEPGTYDQAEQGFPISVENGRFILAIESTTNNPKDVILNGNDNSRVFYIGKSSGVVLQGLTVTRGRSTADMEYGGAVYVDENARNVFFDNCVFSDSQSQIGGAVYWESDDDRSQINNCVFENNHASYFGGGLFLSSESKTFLQKSTFKFNTAQFGGGLQLYNQNYVIDSVFENNTASKEGGGMRVVESASIFTYHRPFSGLEFRYNRAAFGGAVSDSHVGPKIDFIFEHNVATVDGGAVFLHESASSYGSGTFKNNDAIDGGALYVEMKTRKEMGAITSVNESAFSDNTAEHAGGAIFCAGAVVEWQGNTYTNNVADSFARTANLYCGLECVTRHSACACTSENNLQCGAFSGSDTTAPPQHHGGDDASERSLIAIIVVLLVVMAAGLVVAVYILRQRGRRAYANLAEDRDGGEGVRLDSTRGLVPLEK